MCIQLKVTEKILKTILLRIGLFERVIQACVTHTCVYVRVCENSVSVNQGKRSRRNGNVPYLCVATS